MPSDISHLSNFKKKKKLHQNLEVCELCFWREGALNLSLDIRILWLLSDTASLGEESMWLILSFFFFPLICISLWGSLDRSWGLCQQMWNACQSHVCQLLVNAGQRVHSYVERDSCFVWGWFKSSAVWSALSKWSRCDAEKGLGTLKNVFPKLQMVQEKHLPVLFAGWRCK